MTLSQEKLYNVQPRRIGFQPTKNGIEPFKCDCIDEFPPDGLFFLPGLDKNHLVFGIHMSTTGFYAGKSKAAKVYRIMNR